MFGVAVAILLSRGQAEPRQSKTAAHEKRDASHPAGQIELVLEPKALDVLKAASARLAAAKAMTFTAVASYESPSLYGPPLIYTTTSDVTLRRPDKLRVITSGDGPASEFYYDGKSMMAYAPAENLVAVASAPSTIDAALKQAYDSAAIYFPFSDVVVADPYKDMADQLKIAFYIGQSRVVGGTTSDMVGIANDHVFVQLWIGAEDKLPRMIRAIYLNDPSKLRHLVEFSKWHLDEAVADDSFASSRATSAPRIAFERPDPKLPPGAMPPVKASKPKPK